MILDANSREIQVSRYVGNPQIINMTVASASILLLPKTVYRLWASVNAFFVIGTGGASATTSSNPLTAGLDALLVTDETNTTIAGIVAAGTGVLYVSKLDPVSN